MKRLIFLTIILSGCSVKYQGLIVDKYLVMGEVIADSGFARVEIHRKYSHDPVVARVTVNNRLLSPGGPGLYQGVVSGSPYSLVIETYDERVDISVDSPGIPAVSGEFFGDTLHVIWSSSNNASYYRIILEGGSLLDTVLTDTSIEVQTTLDTINYLLLIFSGPGFEDGNILPNLTNEMWEVYFKVVRSVKGSLRRS